MFFGSTSSRSLVGQLLAAPAVAQRDGDRALGVVLADDEAVELGDDLARGRSGHRHFIGSRCLDGDVAVGVDADVGGDRHGLAAAIASASRPSTVSSARAAASAKLPPEPMPIRCRPPAPARRRCRSAPARRRRRPPPSSPPAGAGSGRCASPWRARRRRAQLVGIRSSLASSRSNRVKASAVAPAKPAITLPLPRRRTLRGIGPLMTVWPRLTWPSPAMATLPPLRTATEDGGAVPPGHRVGQEAQRQDQGILVAQAKGGGDQHGGTDHVLDASTRRVQPARHRGPGSGSRSRDRIVVHGGIHDRDMLHGSIH
jgi:hypothetical protein